MANDHIDTYLHPSRQRCRDSQLLPNGVFSYVRKYAFYNGFLIPVHLKFFFCKCIERLFQDVIHIYWNELFYSLEHVKLAKMFTCCNCRRVLTRLSNEWCHRTFPENIQISIQITLYHLTKSPCVPLKKTPNQGLLPILRRWHVPTSAPSLL